MKGGRGSAVLAALAQVVNNAELLIAWRNGGQLDSEGVDQHRTNLRCDRLNKHDDAVGVG